MKRRIVQIITVCLVLSLAVLCVPGSYAKYATTNKLVVSVKMAEVKKFFNTTSTSTLNSHMDSATAPAAQNFTIEKSGYYVIVAKGGNGAFGYKNLSRSREYYAGGTGGTVYGVYYLNQNDVIKAYPGGYGVSAGEVQSTLRVGNGGLNALSDSRFKGGKGSKDVVSSGSLADLFSAAMASGGGGAATLVFLNGTSDSNTIMIAGGGGASGSWDSTSLLGTVASGIGGNGGSIGNTNTPVSTPVAGTVYQGSNGTGAKFEGKYTNDWWTQTKTKTIITYGTGGYITGGTPGYSDYITFTVSSVLYAAADAGGAYNNGCGGNCNDFGGGGGGGYCGGGGGAGTSIKHADGGGGGGSSFRATTVNGKTVKDFTGNLSDVINKASGLPAQSGAKNFGDGYVIVMYVGEEY